MPYGIIKVDTVTFTDNGVDKNISLSGLVQNPTFTGNVTATGTISGDIIRGGTTVSGLTVTGTTANFVSGVFSTQLSGTTITGATVAATTGNFTSLTGTTTTGTTANFISGVFSTQISGTTIIAPTGTFTSLTGTTTTGTTANFASGVFTTQVSGVTITGTTVATTTGTFVSLTGTTATFTSGIIASGTAALPSLAILSDPNTGIFSPGADQVAVATNGVERLIIDSTGKVGVGTTNPAVLLHASGSGTQAIRLENTLGTGDVNLELKLTNNTFTTGLNNTSIFYNDTAGREYIWYQNHAERIRITTSGRLLVGTSTANTNGGVLQLKSGITFPATAVAATDANTLDDYEEGTWTPNQGSGLTVVGTFSSVGRYTKVGNLVYVSGSLAGSTSIAITAGSILCSNLIFTQGIDGCGGNCVNYNINQTAGLFATGGTTNLYASSGLTASLAIFFGFTFRV